MRDRHTEILQIIKDYVIDTQEELAKKLGELGYGVTQATVSRDIKKLRLTKKTDENGVSRYTAPDEEFSSNDMRFDLFERSVVSVDYAENLIVIKTYPGMAQALAASFDSFRFDGVLGTVAGDDTILAVARDKARAHDVTVKLNDMR